MVSTSTPIAVTSSFAKRCIEIVSEATLHIPDNLKARSPDQPWHEIEAIGNLLRHHYQRVDDLITWKIATRSLPDLRRVVVGMMGEDEP